MGDNGVSNLNFFELDERVGAAQNNKLATQSKKVVNQKSRQVKE